jgi:hypothetical protein
MGFIPVPSQGWGTDPPPTLIFWDTTNPNYRQNLALITMLADTLRSRGIHWIMINFPVSPNFRHTGDYYTEGGPSWPTAHVIIQYLQELDSSNAFFHFYDANMDGNHDYSDDEALDCNHLSAQGAVRMSRRVDSIIHTVLP